MLEGVLFFPVTPFTATGEVDLDALRRHIAAGVDASPGGVFVACGTGEFHALDLDEFTAVVRTAVDAVGGRVPVYAGAGGALGLARRFARAAAEAGADGLLLMPPYLVEAPAAGLVAYTREVAGETDLPLIVYNRANARFDERSAAEVAQLHTVMGLKDGTGDLDLVARIVPAVRDSLDGTGKQFQFFNGMPTAEASQQAYRALGVELYSSAAFAFAPDVSIAFHRAVEEGDQKRIDALQRAFFHPLVRLRQRVPGYAVALVKAGVTLEGIEAGPVRPPLTSLAPQEVEELAAIIAEGRAVLAS
ncbi:putative 5-dehydro-4-deoxyglucarate dehydratase [Streptomyces spinoverrucosus]|uniref:Probable 5-dehydro-4-deoxyglucarate dehydratase n=1 Tax=Streptomyces spinoverrucosus TaxID=284043 RepID=A0A4Y3VIK4_9ACTN|nr:5-dehydro-4-deoxyglucarate dehydratase [Streptomyces spinoverrucosus]GEC06882.1 putative 5-dehydro-4-deoxyglucarate dehydratase [Streptomyces spinoverrucosus]GHB85176.1 putative 5-dehydro-4-deoxyglucarate dehydratase [Streptomyces spinoverrucosus]